MYGEYAEGQRQIPLTPTSMESWVRPLSGISKLRWGAVYEHSGEFDTYLPAEPITVTFTDGLETTIPEADSSIPTEQRSAVDALLTALRKGVSF